ncbi:MAG: DUF6464 family protein [Alphaproteobacteria bacterium]
MSKLLQNIGNPQCQYNANSYWLRCAVNPKGSCNDCDHFSPQGEYDPVLHAWVEPPPERKFGGTQMLEVIRWLLRR